MGYRSNIYIKTTTPLVASAIYTLIAAVEPNLFNQVGPTKLIGEYLKWYEVYSDVRTITKLLNLLDEDTFAMLAIGEDGTVHSELGNHSAVDLYTYTNVNW